jgi:drug/metabolite transporter (DMT)-like permease
MLTVVAFALTAAYVVVRRVPLRLPRGEALPVGAIGALNVAALALYAVSSTRGLVAVVSVLASLYPVVTVVLAQVVYGERLRGIQLGGVAAAFAGVVCLAAG